MTKEGGSLPELLTPDEVAEVVRVLPAAVREWLRTGRMRAFKVGNQWRIPRAEVEAFLERSTERALDSLASRIRSLPIERRLELERWLDRTEG
jgi:excisionase family DNA binding protein